MGDRRLNPYHVRKLIQLAWRFLRFQKNSALAQWYQARTADRRGATRKTMIVALVAQAAHRTLALCHDGPDTGRRRLTSSGLKGLTGTSITIELFGARWLSGGVPN